MYKEIEIERAILESKDLIKTESKDITETELNRNTIVYFFKIGIFGSPFLFLGEKKKANNYSLGFLFILSMITILYIGGVNFLTWLFPFAFLVFYFIDFTKTLKKNNIEKRTKELERFKYVKEKIEKLEKNNKLNSRFDQEIKEKIIDFDLKNKEKNLSKLWSFWFFFSFLGLSSYYVEDKKNARNILCLFILSVVINLTLSFNGYFIAFCFFSYFFSILLKIMEIKEYANINEELNLYNTRIKEKKLLMLRMLEKEISKRDK